MVKKSKLVLKKNNEKRTNVIPNAHKKEHSKTVDSPIDQISHFQRTIGNQAVQGLFKSGSIQTKLKIGNPNDKYEQEADRVTDIVIRMPEPKESQVTGHELPDKKENVQAKETGSSTAVATPGIESSINSLRRGGQPLSESTRKYFEPRFGYDFSAVRVYTGEKAIEAARVVNSEAFTIGNNIVFNSGNYSPDTEGGKRLLAHELTHVVQQSKNILPKIQRKVTWNSPTLNRRNAAEVMYNSKALMGSPVGLTTLVVNGKDIDNNSDLMSAIPAPSIDSVSSPDGSIKCWFKNPVNATANCRLDILTKPPWKMTLPTTEVAKRYPYESQCKGKTGNTDIIARDWYKKDAKLEKLVHKGELEHNNAYEKVFKKLIGNYASNVAKHLGSKKGIIISGTKAPKPNDCVDKLRKIENRQLLTDLILAINKANTYIHRNNRHEVTVCGLTINKNCSQVLYELIPPHL